MSVAFYNSVTDPSLTNTVYPNDIWFETTTRIIRYRSQDNLTWVLQKSQFNWNNIVEAPSTLGGYGITDALPISGGELIGNLSLPNDPTANLHAATKQYVDNVAAGIRPLAAVHVATTGPVTLSGYQNVDGYVLVDGDRVLVKDQADPIENGLYLVGSGAWSRTLDMDGSPTYETQAGSFVFVDNGTINKDSGFVLLGEGVLNPGTDPLNWTQFSGASQVIDGDGLTKVGNQLNVSTASVTRIVVNADSIDLAQTAVTPGTGYNLFDVDAYGRITYASSITAPVNKGGTGLTSTGASDTLLGVASSGTALEYKSLSGYSNQITVTHSAGAITLTLPQDISTTSDVEFKSLKLAAGTTSKPPITLSSGSLLSTVLDGTFEYDGTKLYFSIGTDRKTVAYVDGDVLGNAASATKLQTPRTIGMTGDVTWSSGSFDGTANVTGSSSLSLTGISAGTYTKLTIDTKGRATFGSYLTAADIPSLSWTKITSGKPTTLSGYGITDAVQSNAPIVSGTGTKVMFDAKGLVLSATTLSDTDIPNLSWSKITSGKPTTLSGYGITDAYSTSSAIHEISSNVTGTNIDVSLGAYFYKTISGATTFTVSNVPTSGKVASFILELTNGGSSTVTWWSGVKWAAGTAPTLTASGVDLIGFMTRDGGTTWHGILMSSDSK